MYNPQLETFIKVADEGSFSKAAELLYISPNAVIKQINSLESHLDLRLFVRTPRGITLTPAGESLYRDAKYIIQYSKDSVIKAKNLIQQKEHVIHIVPFENTPVGDYYGSWRAMEQLYSIIDQQVMEQKGIQIQERIQENFNVFDFNLSDEDMKTIATLDTGKSCFFSHQDPVVIEMLCGLKR